MNNLANLKIEVIPNNNNKSGIVFIIYKRSFFSMGLWAEYGRLATIKKVKKFLDAYTLFNGIDCKTISLMKEAKND